MSPRKEGESLEEYVEREMKRLNALFDNNQIKEYYQGFHDMLNINNPEYQKEHRERLQQSDDLH